MGTSHSDRSSLKLSKDAFSSLTAFLEARSGSSPFKGKRTNVTSLGPFGVRHGLAGLSVAPRFLCLDVWLPFLHALCKDQSDPARVLGATQVGSLPLFPPPSSSLLFGRVSLAFFLLLWPSPSDGRVFPRGKLLACLLACLLASRPCALFLGLTLVYDFNLTVLP